MSASIENVGQGLTEQMGFRQEKVSQMRAAGVDPYPVEVHRTSTISEIREKHQGLEPETYTKDRVAIAGRVMLSRVAGKLCFATVRDGSGDIQVMLSQDSVGEESLDLWKRRIDLGDHVAITGEVITSRRGELSVLAEDWTITSKALRPLPDKHHGLTDPQARVRQRYLDLIVNPEAANMVSIRSRTVRSIRESLHQRGYLEVETPMLQSVQGGATARPFVTHINAYDLDLYLRIAPELYLKRLVVGGIERVFELNRNFRNEGADATHNPEFTMLEFYEAYGTYDTVATVTREIIQEAAIAALGTTVIERDGQQVDIGGEWPSITLHEAVSEALGVTVSAETSVEELRKHADAHQISYDPKWGPGKLTEELFEALAEHKIITPTFVRDYPVETSPLTRQHRENPLLTEKWDLIAFGMEVGTGYSELVDPAEQRRRLVEQAALASGGDAEAMHLDEDFLTALEHGMPPTGGVGFGVDRVLMLFTGKNIRETVLFPLVKPK